jgi:hypothetical protein
MKIKVFYGNQPVLDTRIESEGVNKGKEYGLNRDRNPDSGWGELNWKHMEGEWLSEVEMTDGLKAILLQDLAYADGNNSNEFLNKLHEFELI